MFPFFASINITSVDILVWAHIGLLPVWEYFFMQYGEVGLIAVKVGTLKIFIDVLGVACPVIMSV